MSNLFSKQQQGGKTGLTAKQLQQRQEDECFEKAIADAKGLEFSDEEINRACAELRESRKEEGKKSARTKNDLSYMEKRRREQAARRQPRKVYKRSYRDILNQMAAFYGEIDRRLDLWFEEREAALGVEPFATRVRKRKEHAENIRALLCADLVRRGHLVPHKGKEVR